MVNKTNKREFFFGFKNSELVYHVDEVYYSYMLLLEFDNTVKNYFQPQAEILLRAGAGDRDSLKLDFWVRRQDESTELVHIYREETLDPSVLRQGIEYSFGLRANFKAIPAREILLEPRKSNLQKLWKHAHREVKNIHVALLNTFFKEKENTTVLDLQNYLSMNGFAPELIYNLIFHKALLADLDNFPITEQTIISPNAGWVCTPRSAREQFLYLEIWRGFEPEDNLDEIF
jgi:hypothetical protein